jgi:hypothetical protein
MSNPKNCAISAKTEKVDVFIPKGYANDEPNLTICINGVNYVLPKGKTSAVPVFVAEEFHRSQRAAETQDENKGKLLEAAK